MLQVKHIEKYYGSKNNVTKTLDRVLFLKDAGPLTSYSGGERGRAVFYRELLDVLTFLGGDVSDVL